MKKFNKVSAVLLAVAFALGLTGSSVALAATTPSLGTAATYGVLSSTYTNTTAGTTINGDVGFTTGPAVVPAGVHTNYGVAAPYDTAGADQGSALSALDSQPCTFTFAIGAIDLSTDTTHGPIGVYTPGVYCSTGAMDVGGPLTLNGSGTYIFRPAGALTSTAGAVVTLNGASACDVFWTPTSATTLAANTTFAGTIIDNSGITVGANTTWTGMALAFGGTVTTDTDTITVPICAAVSPMLTVTKTVINTGGGTRVVSDFPLFIDGGSVTSGVANTTTIGAHTVSETSDSGYTSVIGGDCAADGTVTLAAGESKTCTITNTYIAIAPTSATLHVVKTVINDNGGTAVASDFTLNVTGTNVSQSSFAGSATGVDVTLDAGSYSVTEPIVPAGYLQTASADCSGTIAAGETKTCTITNNDIAPATAPVTATLHVVKTVINDNGGTAVASDFTLNVTGTNVSSSSFAGSATGVDVTLDAGSYSVTEPIVPAGYLQTASADCSGTIAAGETKTCTITNNDIAPAPAPVTVPRLPNTGIGPNEKSIPWNIVIPAGIFAILTLFYFARKKQTN